MENNFIKIEFIIKYIFLFVKNFKRILISYYYFFVNNKIFNYFFFKIGLVKHEFRDNNINIFLNKNEKLNKQRKQNIFNSKAVLIELLLSHHSEPMIMNCLIAKDIQKKYNLECVGLVKKNDLLTKKIAESFGIKKFVFIENENFLKKIYYLIKAFNLVSYKNIEHKLIKIKYNGHEVGKSAYEHYLRFHNMKFDKKDKFLLFICLANALQTLNNAAEIFKKKYKFFVLGETQFIPNKLLFHYSLKSNVPVYTYFGSSSINFIGRIYNSYKERNSSSLKFSKKLSNLLLKIFKNKKIIIQSNKKKFLKLIGKETVWSSYKRRKNLNFKNREKFQEYFKFNPKKKNVLFLPHAMADNLYNSEWNLFKTSYEWFCKTLDEIKTIDNVNWLIKPHPYEYKFPGVTAREIFSKFEIKKENIFFLDESIHINEIYKFVDVVLTGNGSAGYEYTCLGIPVITTSDAKYSNFNFTIAPKNQESYFKLLNKINLIKKPSKNSMRKAQIYWSALDNIICNSHKFLPRINQHGKFKKELFFKKLSKKKLSLNNKNSFSKDILFQLSNKNRHSINYNLIEKYHKKYSFYLKDI